MRYMDLVIAGLIASSALTGMLVFAPHQGDLGSSSLASETRLRDELLALLQQKGTAWLIQSSPETVCAYLREKSNSSVTFSGEIGGVTCESSPISGLPSAIIAMRLIGRQVVLEAWTDERG